MPLRLGSLFSGIGGLELGLERAGLGRTVYQVERDAYARHVLARHWPDVPRFDDVRTVGAHNLPRVDVICGGFPCQQISAAGRMEGLGTPEAPTDRSGLWFEMRRIIDEQRPAWVVVENVAHTWRRYVPLVRRELWELGYATLPLRVRACDVGARHERARILLVAGSPADVGGLRGPAGAVPGLSIYTGGPGAAGGSAPDVDRLALRVVAERAAAGRVNLRGGGEAEPGEDALDAPDHARLGLAIGCDLGSDGDGERAAAPGSSDDGAGWESPGWGLPPAPALGGGLHGLPGGVDGPWKRAGWTGARLREARIRGLGNSVVPAVSEAVGRLIADAIARSLLVAPDVAAVAK
jgi:DNA (cytosine-5)-methyltransferase 1